MRAGDKHIHPDRRIRMRGQAERNRVVKRAGEILPGNRIYEGNKRVRVPTRPQRTITVPPPIPAALAEVNIMRAVERAIAPGKRVAGGADQVRRRDRNIRQPARRSAHDNLERLILPPRGKETDLLYRARRFLRPHPLQTGGHPDSRRGLRRPQPEAHRRRPHPNPQAPPASSRRPNKGHLLPPSPLSPMFPHARQPPYLS